MDFTKTIINAVKIWVNKQLSFIENKISDLENRPSAFIQPEEPSETPDGTLWIDTDEDSISGVGSNTAESLTFTGVVEATYNGLSPVTVNIPKVTVNGITSDENGNIEIEVGSEQIQTDWNQNDSTQPDYIKNRTHWIEGSTYHTLSDNFIPETIARTSAVEEIKTLVGETPVSEQISEAIAEIPAVEIPVTSVNGMTGDVVIEAGGVTSWNDLKDKPFGTEGTRVVAEWDGNTEGREFFTNYALYKVSDLVPAMSDMVGVKYSYKYNYGKTVEYTFEEDGMVQFNGYYIIKDVMIVIEDDNSTLSNDTLSTGIYVIIHADDSLCYDGAGYITSMTIADTTITFDGVTVEENVVYLKDDISIFGNEVEYYYKISDAAPTLADWESTNAIATTFMGNKFCLWGFIQEWTAETQTTEIIPCPFIGVFGVYGSMTNANNKKLSHGIYVKKGIKKIAYGDYTTQKIDTDYYLTDLIVYGYPFVDSSTVLDPSHLFSDINEAFKSGRTVVFTDINHIVANRGVYYYLQDVEIDNYYHFTSHTGKYTHDIYVYADDTWEYKVTMSNDISWHELANRPFYTEISDDTEVLFENQNFSVREQRGMTVCNLPDGTTLTAGDVYIVVVNGTEYTLTAAEADYHGYASVYLGDFSIANEFNTSPEVDVCVLYVVEMNATMLIVPGSLETITASLYKGTEIVHTLNEKFIPDTIARIDEIPEQTQADWEQSDSTAKDYVKNRTHYKQAEDSQEILNVLYEASTLSDKYYQSDLPIACEPVLGASYNVWIYGEGTTRGCVLKQYNDTMWYLGNLTVMPYNWYDGDDTGENFLITFRVSNGQLAFGATADICTSTYTTPRGDTSFTVTGPGVIYHQLDKKYLPDDVKDFVSKSYVQSVNGFTPNYDGSIWMAPYETTEEVDIVEGLYTCTDSGRVYGTKNKAVYETYIIDVEPVELIVGEMYTVSAETTYGVDGDYKHLNTNPLELKVSSEGHLYIGNPAIAGLPDDVGDQSDMTVGVVFYHVNNVVYGLKYCSNSYILYNNGSHNLTITGPRMKYVQLDEKFIPDTIARVSDIPEQQNITVNGIAPDENGNIEIEVTSSGGSAGGVTSWNDLIDKPFYEEGSGATIEWDGNTEGRDSFTVETMGATYYKVSDSVPSIGELINVTVGLVMEGNESGGEFPAEFIKQFDGCFGIGENYVVVQNTEFTFGETVLSAPSVGIYFVFYNSSTYASKLTYGSTTIKTLDEKFIPDTIARVGDITAPKTELILTSSTSGSTKKFKITIDDDGVLTATEIVETEA